MEGGPVCSRCEATSSLMWSRSEDGSILCLGCHRAEKNAAKSTSSSESRTATPSRESTSPANAAGTPSRRTRMKERTAKARQAKGGSTAAADKSRSGTNGQPGGQTCGSGGRGNHQTKGRRTLAKEQKLPAKAPKSRTTIVTSDAVFHEGTSYEVGDVVSVLDADGGVYFAIIRGFLQNQYGEKYAILTWLLPTHPNPTHFDPHDFVLGPEEDSPTLMDFLEFVCHSPQSCHFRDSFRHNFEQAELWRGAGNLVHVAGSDSPRAGSHTGGCSPQHGNEGQLADGRPVAEEVPASAVSS